MTLRLTSHLYARVAAGFLGFFGGGAVFAVLVFSKPDVHFGLTALLFFGLVFGGTYLAQLAFSLSFPAACPACGAASAVPTLRLPTVYVCRTCGATISAAQAMHAEQLTLMRTRAVRQQESESPLVWMFVVVGVGLVGFAIWLARDASGLLRDGISTEAKVMRVTQMPSHDIDGMSETSYTAFIQYHDGKMPQTLKRSWSVPDGGRCGWPCYYEGQSLKVIYVPREPTRAKVHSRAELFFAPGLISMVGLVFASFGVLMIRHRRRRRPQLES